MDRAAEPLGHHVTLEAPPGIATGLAVPVQARPERPELELAAPEPRAPEPRGLRGWVRRLVSGEPRPEASGAGPEARAVQRAEQLPEPRDRPETEGEAALPKTPPRPLEAVEAPGEPEGSLVEAELAERPSLDLRPRPAAPDAAPQEALGHEPPSEPPEPAEREIVREVPAVPRKAGLGPPLTHRPTSVSEEPRAATAPSPEAPRAQRIQRRALQRAPEPGERSATPPAREPGTEPSAPPPRTEAGEPEAPEPPAQHAGEGEGRGPDDGGLESAEIIGEKTPLVARAPDHEHAEAEVVSEGGGPPRPDLPLARRAPEPVEDAEGPGGEDARRVPRTDVVEEPAGWAEHPRPEGRPQPARLVRAPVAPLVSRRPVYRAARRPRAEEAPQEVRVDVERRFGADLSDVPIHRTEEVGEAARALRARAYTARGEVHLPEEHGPLREGPAKSLLAHELTHVAQQRRLGRSLPPEDSAQGRALEAEARGVESAWGEAATGPPVTSAPRPQGPVVSRSEQAAEAAPGPPELNGEHPPLEVVVPPAPVPVAPPVQRAPPRAVAVEDVAPTLEPARAEESGKASPEELARIADEVLRRLRSELVVDRERAGKFTDRL